MTANEYMKQLEKLDVMITCKKSELESLKCIAACAVSSLKDVVVSTSKNISKTEDCVVKIIELKQEISELIEKYIDAKRERLNMIEKLSGNEYNVLYKRYFEKKPYETIAEEMFFSRMHIYRIHKSAMNKLDKLLN